MSRTTRRCMVCIWSLTFLLGCFDTASAQLERGILEGSVTDPQGAYVPNVKVTLTAIETGVALPSVTNSVGYYRVIALVPGKYSVHFDAAGFSPLDLTDIVVPPGKTIRADAQLQLGAERQTIEVSAASSIVQTAPTNFSTDVGTDGLQYIPLQGRDLQQLVFLVPGVIGNGPPGSSFGFNSQFGTFPDPTHLQGTDVAVNGGQGGLNAWYLDGNLNQSSALAETIVVNPSPDAVEEFQTITNGLSAEYGRTGGGVFNVVLKSGTNQFHGNVYEYIRNSYFNARNPFTSISSTGQIIPQNQLHFNNFGGTLGGPLVIPHIYDGRKKTFFFFSWDESILHLNGNGVFTVPTPLMRQGDFSEDPSTAQYGLWNPYSTVGPNTQGLFQRTAIGTPASGYPNGCLNSVVEANPGVKTCNFATQLPTNMTSKTAMYFINQFPLPNYLNPLSGCPLASGGAYRICSNYLGAIGSSQDGTNISLKIDHQWSDKNRFFFEWLFNPGNYNNYRLPWTGPTFPEGSVGFGSNVPFDFTNQIIAFGNTYTFNPTLVNEFRANFSRQFYTTHPETAGYPDSVTGLSGVQNLLAPLGIPLAPGTPAPSWYVFAPVAGFSSYMNFGPLGWVNNRTASESYTILDNLTKVLAKHTLRTGFVYRLSHAAEFQNGPTNLFFAGSGNVDPTTGLGGGGGLAEFMTGAVMGTGDSGPNISWQPYLRDRYWGFYGQDEFRVTPNLTLNLGLRYDIFGTFKPRVPNSFFCLSCPNTFTGLPGIVQYANTDYVPPNWNDIAPRISFSWAPFADRKTVVRGGYNVFYTNAISSINSPQNIDNLTGYSVNSSWLNSNNPGQCAPFSGHCVSFSLDSPGDKSSSSTPPFSTTLPAVNKDQEYQGYIGAMQKPAHDPMVQTWTLEIQRLLPADTVFSVGYVGTHGTHLVGNYNWEFNHVSTADVLKYRNTINAQVPISDYYSGQTAQALQQVWGSSSLPRSTLLKPYPFWSSLNAKQTYDGTNIYHALQVRLDKHYSQGLYFTVVYTFSKNITNAFTGQMVNMVIDPIHLGPRTGFVGGLTGAFRNSARGYRQYQDPDNANADRALAFNDTPQMLTTASTYQLPFGYGRSFLNRKGPINFLLGGWHLTGIFNATSGVPLSISGPCNAITCRPNLVGNPKAVDGGQNAAHWINAAAFLPPFGGDQAFWADPNPTDDRWWQFGNAGTRLSGLRSPGFWNLDASLGKQFKISESKYFDFRWEVFNALNHQNLGIPNTNYCLPPAADGSTDLVHQAGCQFGRITNIQTDPRTMEFALKFYW